MTEYFQSPKNKIVATLIHKMNKLIKNPQNNELLEKWRQKKIFFMIDECHRTQSGSMHNTLKNTFPQARFFGFTGTPFFKDHIPKNEKSTQELFGECKHSYTMYRALQEKKRSCVVPFSIRYLSKKNQEAKVQYILNHHHKISQKYKYNAILIAQDIKHLLRYYELFRESRPSFKIAAIFSNNIDSKENSEQKKDISEKQLEKIMKEYGHDDIKTYHQKILNDMKKGGGTIDLLIVVRMFLTGFDSSLLNALYVDRPLKKHELFQAFSRTIRKKSIQKQYGEIYCFQTTKEDVNTSLEIFAFSNKDDSANAMKMLVRSSYDEVKTEYEQKMQDFLKCAPTPGMVDQGIIGFKKKEDEYLQKFCRLKEVRKKIETYRPEFGLDQNNFPINEENFLHYQSKYKKIRDGKSRKIISSSALNFEEEKQKYQEYIKDLRKIVPIPEDINLNDKEKKSIFIKKVNDLEEQLEIMREYFNTKFNINDFPLSEEELKLYQQKRDQFDKEDDEDKPPHIIDLDYLLQIILHKLIKSGIPLETIKKESGILLFTLLSNLPLNQKTLWQDYFRSDYFSEYYRFAKKETSYKILSEHFHSNYYNFIEKTSIQELEEKANELHLPFEELEKIIEFKKNGQDSEMIRKYIHKLLNNNPQAINTYRKNNSQSNILEYKSKYKLKNLIYDFIEDFIKKYNY